MIYLKNIRNIQYDAFDEIWLVVRSVGKAASMLQHPNVKHVPELSPSLNLFFQYRNWMKNGTWNYQAFLDKYVPQFLRESKNPEFKKRLEELKSASTDKKIALVCFCPNETTCHRSILGAICLTNGIATERPETMLKYQNLYHTDILI